MLCVCVCVCVCVHVGERSCAPECADKLVKWGVVPGGTLTLSVGAFLPSHIIILPTLLCSQIVPEFAPH